MVDAMREGRVCLPTERGSRVLWRYPRGRRTRRRVAMANKGPPPNPEEKARYDKVKDELAKMLLKKRAADRQLVRPAVRSLYRD